MQTHRVGILNDATMGSNFNVLTQMSIGADNNNRAILDFSSAAFSIGTIQSGTSTFSTFSVSSGAVFCNNSTSLGTSLIINNTSNGSGSTLKFLNDSSSPANDDVLGSIDFNGNDDGGTQTTFARIRAGANNVANGSEDGFMAFAISDDASLLEHMRCNTAGVVINELSQAGTDLRVESNDNSHMLFVDSGANSIGINASNPTHPIDITANSSAHGVRIRGRSADDIGEINFQSNDGGTAHSQLQSLSTELKIRNIANIPMTFHTNNTERVRIANNGDTMIGTTVAPTGAGLAVNSGINTSGINTIEIQQTTTGANKAAAALGVAIGNGGESTNAADLTFSFSSGGSLSEGGRFNTAGKFFVNATSDIGPGIIAASSTASATGAFGAHNSNSGGSLMRFANAANNAVIGSISNNGNTAVAYNTTSDARLKEVTGEAKGLEIINQLNPVSFDWKETGEADQGLLAQEVMEILPNIVTGSEKDHYQLDYTKIITPLIKAVQEQQKTIKDLLSRIESLEA